MLFVYDVPDPDAAFDLDQHVAELQRFDNLTADDFAEFSKIGRTHV